MDETDERAGTQDRIDSRPRLPKNLHQPQTQGEPVMKREATTETQTPELEPLSLDLRAAEIYCWRVEQLTRAGFAGDHAHLLAEDTSVDLHAACDLVLRGCPSRIAEVW